MYNTNTVIKVEDSSMHRGPLIYKRLTGLCGAINNIYTYKEVHTDTHSSIVHSFVEFCNSASVDRAYGLHLDCVHIRAMNRDLEEEYHGIAHCAQARFMQDAELVVKVEDASPNHGTTVHERLTALCGEIRDYELSGITTHSFIKFKEARSVMRACALCLEGVTIRALTPALEKQYRDVVREAPSSAKEACNTSIRSSTWFRAPASVQVTKTQDQHNTRLRKRSSQGTSTGPVPALAQKQDHGLANLRSEDPRSVVSVRAVCTSEHQGIQDTFHESCGPIRHTNQCSPPSDNVTHSFAEFKDVQKAPSACHHSLKDVEIQSLGCDSPDLKDSLLHAVSNDSTVMPSSTVPMSKTTSLSQPPIFPWKLSASSSSNARKSMFAPANGSASAPSTNSFPWASAVPIPAPERSAFVLSKQPPPKIEAHKMHKILKRFEKTAEVIQPGFIIPDAAQGTMHAIADARATVDELNLDYPEVQRAIHTESVFQPISPGAVNNSCGAITKSKDATYSEARGKRIRRALIYEHTGKENTYKARMKRKVAMAGEQALQHGAALHSELREEDHNMQLACPEPQPLSTPRSLTSATILLQKASTPKRNVPESQRLKLEPKLTPTPNCLIPVTVPLSRPAIVSPLASVPASTSSIPMMQSEISTFSRSTQFKVIETTTGPSFTLQTNLTLAIYGEVVNYDLNTLDPEPRTIIEMLKMSASERDKWMVIGCYYRNKGIPEAAIKVVQTMIRVMKGRGVQDADLKPAFLLLFDCETLLCKMVLAKESRRSECSDEHARKALEWLHKIYNDVNLPLSVAEREASSMLSMPSPKLTSPARHTADSMGPIPAVSPPTSPTAFLSHLQQLEEELKQLREDKQNLIEELSTVCAAKRLLEEDTNIERNVRRRLERELYVEQSDGPSLCRMRSRRQSERA
ncbi:hypothetical protein HWV62_27243 [Athelia sp. TMB]|nr:hypothetical protein HWV62_27243 [Athelia sp. TMB]